MPDPDAAGEKWAGQINWLLLLLGPVAVGFAVATSMYDDARFQDLQIVLEYTAPWMVALAGAVYAVRSAVTRNPLYVLLTVLAVIFTLREFHFDWVHDGVYVMLAALAVWAAAWRKRLAGPLKDFQHTSWLIATFAAYVLSQLIARRAFRVIPGEHQIHRSLEECAETAAHLMFIATSLVGDWRRYVPSGGRGGRGESK